MVFRILRHHHNRVTSLEEEAKAAMAERELSERRLKHMRDVVAGPARLAGDQNQFAQIIRQSLRIQHNGREST